MRRIQFEGGPWHGRIETRHVDQTDVGKHAFRTENHSRGYYRISTSTPPGPDADWLARWVPSEVFAD